MKKLVVLLLLIAAGLALRFIEVQAPADNRSAPALVCRNPGEAPNANVPTCDALKAVGAAYEKNILPIFSAKCLMCHGVVPKFPLYAKVPPSSWLIRHDMEEAKEHMDMSFGFPFRGKDAKTPMEALTEIAEVVREDEMPPVVYKIMHWHSSLSDAEKKAILDWTNQGMGQFK
ncbi:MAG TPA: heme-binding domain-containing protein [bacterium]|nr:heme-binding domain-containing protein [bacterium]